MQKGRTLVMLRGDTLLERTKDLVRLLSKNSLARTLRQYDRSHLYSSIGRTEVFFIQCFNRSTCGLCCMSTCEISWGFLDTMRISIASSFPFWPHVFSFQVVHPLTSLDDPSPNGVSPLNQHIYHFPRGIGNERAEKGKKDEAGKKKKLHD